jgi:hypothetical protein
MSATRRKAFGLSKGSKKIHLVKTIVQSQAYSWCGYGLPLWFDDPPTMTPHAPFRYCQRCLSCLNEAQSNPDSVWKEAAKEIVRA